MVDRIPATARGHGALEAVGGVVEVARPEQQQQDQGFGGFLQQGSSRDSG